MKEFVFQIGDRDIIVEASNEKDALLQAVDFNWPLINEVGYIELMGEITEKYKVEDMPNDWKEQEDRDWED